MERTTKDLETLKSEELKCTLVSRKKTRMHVSLKQPVIISVRYNYNALFI